MGHVPASSLEQNNADPHAPRARRLTVRHLALIGALLIAVAAVGAQFEALREAGQRTATNVALLQAAMPGSFRLFEFPGASSLSNPVGVQARALAQLAETSGQLATAEQHLAAGLATEPGDQLTRFALCRFYASGDRWEEAGRTCAGSELSLDYWLLMGVRATESGRSDEALELFRVAVAASPDNMEAWLQLARTALSARRFPEAITAYERVLALDWTQPFEVFNSLGTAYLAAGDYEKAQDIANRGLLVYPDHRELYLIVGESVRRQGDLSAADEWYIGWLERWPNDAYAWAQRGEIALLRGRAGDAVGFFQRATDLEPATAGYWQNLARAAVEADQIVLGTQAHEMALALRPDDPAVWLAAARFLAQTNQTERARMAFERVLALQPDNSEAATELASLGETLAP